MNQTHNHDTNNNKSESILSQLTSSSPQHLLRPPPRDIIDGVIILVAKCPIPGKCKTRLATTLGNDGASRLAKAMLCDILWSLGRYSPLRQTKKILLYAPPDETGRRHMTQLLSQLYSNNNNDSNDDTTNDDDDTNNNNNNNNNDHPWTLMPMTTPLSTSSKSQQQQSLTSSHLGSLLTNALLRVKSSFPTSSSLMFLGMDAPELPPRDILRALLLSSSSSSSSPRAYLCPAADGGYGLLSIPSNNSSTTPLDAFNGVRWSHPLTAVSQLKALTDAGMDVTMGGLMYDMDEMEDVRGLISRWRERERRRRRRRMEGDGGGSWGEDGGDEIPKGTSSKEEGGYGDDDDVLDKESPIPYDGWDEDAWERECGDCDRTIATLKELGLMSS